MNESKSITGEILLDGPIRVTAITAETFRLDGGAMFGVVPKALWSKRLIPDEQNRIPMVTRVLLIESGDRKILVDVGCGNCLSTKEQEHVALKPAQSCSLDEVLTDVTDVVLTHLHFDHAAGVAKKIASGEILPRFPNANHYIQRSHWEYVAAPHIREKNAFRSDTLQVLNSVKLVLIEGQNDAFTELFPGISVQKSNGHTKGMQVVLVSGSKQTLAFPTDLVPTSHHLPVGYVMGYDQSAELSCDEKQRFLEQAATEQWIVVFAHDSEVSAARIAPSANGKFEIAEKISGESRLISV